MTDGDLLGSRLRYWALQLRNNDPTGAKSHFVRGVVMVRPEIGDQNGMSYWNWGHFFSLILPFFRLFRGTSWPLFSFDPSVPSGPQGGPASAEECPHVFHSFPLHCWGSLPSGEVIELQGSKEGEELKNLWLFHVGVGASILWRFPKSWRYPPNQSKSYKWDQII